MILSTRHIIAQKVADEFRGQVARTHSDMVSYPLRYLNLQIALSEHFRVIVHEIPDMTVQKVVAELRSFGFRLSPESYDKYLNLAGLFYAAGDAVIIFIERRDSEERKKFTLSHEISHFLNEYFRMKLKRKGYGTLSLFEPSQSGDHAVVAKRCSKRDVFSSVLGEPEPDFEPRDRGVSLDQLRISYERHQDRLKERICDWFAAELLMPVSVIKRHEHKWIEEGKSFSEIVESVRSLFEVSWQASRIRAEELQIGNIEESFLS